MEKGRASKTVYPNGEVKALYLEIDPTLHTKFKTKCENKGQKMKFVIAELIKKYVR